MFQTFSIGILLVLMLEKGLLVSFSFEKGEEEHN